MSKRRWLRLSLFGVVLVLFWLLLWLMFRDPVLALLGPGLIIVGLAGGRIASAVTTRQNLATVERMRTRHPEDLVFLGYTFIPSPFRRRRSWGVPLTGLADAQSIRLIPGDDENQPSTAFTWREVSRIEPGQIQSSEGSFSGLVIVADDPTRSVGVQIGGASPAHRIASAGEVADLIGRLEMLRKNASIQTSD